MSRNDKAARGSLDRRKFLQGSALAFGAAALTGPLPFLRTRAMARGLDVCGTRAPSPYGPLFPTRDDATGMPLIMLPQGFRYTTFSWTGDLLSDGNTVQSGHDGMAVVGGANPGGRGRGRSQTLTLIRNHEVFGVGGTPIAPDFNYDSRGAGGTTVLQWQNGRLHSHAVSISGTISNCAGGPSPWGTWCTCEEGVDVGDQPHGYVFESTPYRVIDPTPLKSMGRFAHEAVAFDPRSGHVFLTEDNSSTGGDTNPRPRGNSGLYCFVPNSPLGGVGSLESGGTLYMAQAREDGAPVEDLRDPVCGATYDVTWIPIGDPDMAPSGGLSGPYIQGRADGATRFQRLEGCWWDPARKLIAFNDTEGGPIGAEAGRTDRAEGAVWTYDPRTSTLTCIFVSLGSLSPDGYGADNPDNITVSPNGGMLLCEDGGRNDGDGLSLLGLENGCTYEFARNIIDIENSDADALIRNGHNPAAIGTGDFSGQEWAGATFSPDGQTLFVNIQTPGITFAITGPFQRGPL